ncbi:class I SAM-dependent methyltransferase [Flectobacillus major]|jgi:2-polyprenyl-3-methyl-5-hydroxy-6-metoxy-1,4-benzoquinol methylase|uniref:class I SAM-dependent methyltransferase n=1 Tax=Flectobacillus major TaxID=103 RepID=UPI00042388A3|nr:class I SAM-dependent methyltransferase [Flectobacillus major]
MLEYIEECPVCKNTTTTHFITCKDHTVSHEAFNIVACTACGFKFTNPRPNATEIGKYYQSEAYISHSNTSKGIVAKIYHQVRKITLLDKVKLINSLYHTKGKLLDVGCGTGMFLNTAKEDGWQVNGIEPSDDARKLAEEITHTSIASEVLTAFTNQKFNIITMWHVLEHVHLLNETIDWLFNKIENDGKVIIAVPNYQSYDASVYQESWAAYDVPRHLYHFSKDTIKQLFAAHGFELVKHLPMKFDSFYVSMLSSKYQTGKTNYIGAFLNGLKSNGVGEKNDNNYSSIIYIFEKKKS